MYDLNFQKVKEGTKKERKWEWERKGGRERESNEERGQAGR